MKKIGIMGGTFNPIHNVHLLMAQAAYEQYHLDEIWFMPSKNPPHKEKKEMVSEKHRQRMVKKAIEGIPHFCFSDWEFKREGTTYTCHTLKEIHAQYPDYEIFFILGGDSLMNFDSWHKPEKIMKYSQILAAPRGNMAEEEFMALCKKQGARFGGEILPVHMEQISISSRQIRSLLKQKRSVLSFCPEKVCRYISLHGLYGAEPLREKKRKADKELIDNLYATLPPNRLLHTFGVAYTAAALAARYGADVEKAEFAGMLHDHVKYYSGREMIALCDENGVALTPLERTNTALIHGKLGACFAEERYGIEDEEVLSAIRYHTTGRPNMTLLEKIIYIADYIEPRRKIDGKHFSLEEIRKECFCDIDSGLLMILENTIQYLKTTNRQTDKLSFETYEYYREKQKKRRDGK